MLSCLRFVSRYFVSSRLLFVSRYFVLSRLLFISRYFVLSRLPGLVMLDDKKVDESERREAEKYYRSVSTQLYLF